MHILKDLPFIATVRNFLSVDQCDEIISSSGSFIRSKTVDPETSSSNIVGERTSSTSYIDQDLNVKLQEKVLEFVKSRPNVSDLSIDNFERLQMQLYEEGQEYQRHCDFFKSNQLESRSINQISKSITENNRIATAIIYLNEDFISGETYFPRLDLLVKPETGKMLYFEYNYTSDVNDLTEHAGSPVTHGEKYIITSWIRACPLSSSNC